MPSGHGYHELSSACSAYPPWGITAGPNSRSPVDGSVPATSRPGVNGSGGRSW